MKLPFKYIAILVIVSLAGIFAYQAYWLTGLYHTMHSEMERDITEAMRMSDYNEMMIRVDKMKQDDINHGEVSVSAGYSDDGKSFVRSSTTISREDSLDNTTLHETFMPKGDSVYVTAWKSVSGRTFLCSPKRTVCFSSTSIEKRIKSVGCLPILPESVWKKQSRTQTALPNPH